MVEERQLADPCPPPRQGCSGRCDQPRETPRASEKVRDDVPVAHVECYVIQPLYLHLHSFCKLSGRVEDTTHHASLRLGAISDVAVCAEVLPTWRTNMPRSTRRWRESPSPRSLRAVPRLRDRQHVVGVSGKRGLAGVDLDEGSRRSRAPRKATRRPGTRGSRCQPREASHSRAASGRRPPTLRRVTAHRTTPTSGRGGAPHSSGTPAAPAPLLRLDGFALPGAPRAEDVPRGSSRSRCRLSCAGRPRSGL